MLKFDPVKYSLDENKFLLDHIGKAPVVAMKSIPPGVNPRAVRPVLDRVYELIELERAGDVTWVGVDEVKATINTYLQEDEKWRAERKLGAPRFPSMSSFDSKGRPFMGAIGSDAGKVSTYFDDHGNRHAFEIELVKTGIGKWQPSWTKNGQTPDAGPSHPSALVNNVAQNRIECPACGHTESYNPDSRGSYNSARARMSKHLRNTKQEVDAHKEIYTFEYRS